MLFFYIFSRQKMLFLVRLKGQLCTGCRCRSICSLSVLWR